MTNPNPHNQFQPGNNMNPNGRPKKGYSITEMVREMMNNKPELKQALGTKIFEIALKGDTTAIKLLWQYMDGMPIQKTDITSGGNPINQLSGDTLAKIEEQYGKQSDPNPESNPA